MTTALQQQVFALDARYNAHRVTQSPNFRTLYIRRRSQLLRESKWSVEKWQQYMKSRFLLLQQKHGTLKTDSVSTSSSNISEIKPELKTFFLDVSIYFCAGFDWSVNNDLIVSASLDGSIKVWKVDDFSCLSTIRDPNNAQILCCVFQPGNNNLIICGNSKGELRIANISTGRFLKNVCRIGGNVLSLTSDTNGHFFWAGNDKVQGESDAGRNRFRFCEFNGALCKMKKICLSSNSSITSLSYRAWISREARDPLLLVNATDNYIYLLSNSLNIQGVRESLSIARGGLQLKRKFQNRHQRHVVRSTFCPIMSFRQALA
ncbi:hypothetical protein NQ318_004774 [Aromia moschata]|uniref:Uncharacterized protein n=1 Tax=Aromia moschata TaxID=1265417 RepID=A0AAV8XQE7_9CUCU|nr:hypothetical protein NQ318_004774 [Aromia moschata]